VKVEGRGGEADTPPGDETRVADIGGAEPASSRAACAGETHSAEEGGARAGVEAEADAMVVVVVSAWIGVVGLVGSGPGDKKGDQSRKDDKDKEKNTFCVIAV
jgi:hypothetical protein